MVETSLSMPQHVETYMILLHLGVCTLKFPSPVLGGRARGGSLLGLMPGPHIYIYIYNIIYVVIRRSLLLNFVDFHDIQGRQDH